MSFSKLEEALRQLKQCHESLKKSPNRTRTSESAEKKLQQIRTLWENFAQLLSEINQNSITELDRIALKRMSTQASAHRYNQKKSWITALDYLLLEEALTNLLTNRVLR